MQKSIVVVNPCKATGTSYCGLAKLYTPYKIIGLWSSKAHKEKFGTFASEYIDTELVADSYEYDQLISILTEANPVAFLVGDDAAFPIADKLQIHFHPENCNDPAKHEIRIKKFNYIEHLRQLGIVTINQQLIKNAHQVDPLWSGQYILKPNVGAGNDKIFIITSQQHLNNILSQYKDVEFILQDYVYGEEFCIELCTWGDFHACTTAMQYTGVYYIEGVRPWRADNELLDPNDARVKIACEYAKKVVTALGVRVGLTWTQIKIDPEGKPHLMECNFRSQGNAHVQAIINSTKTSYCEESFRSYLRKASRFYSLDTPMYSKYGEFRKMAINNRSTQRDIERVDWTQVESLPSVLAVWPNQILIPGNVPVTTGFESSIGMVIAQNNDAQQFQQDISKINAWKKNVEY